MASISLKDRIRGSIAGSIAGDALGVPALFKKRSLLTETPISDMQGFGTRNQPPGTWSDHTSLNLCTMESLTECAFDPADMMNRFSKWQYNGYMTASGKKFDTGSATTEAIDRFLKKLPRNEWGSKNDWQNGNGSLMRLLPVSLAFYDESPGSLIEKTFMCCALTHDHIRSKLCCGYFSLMISSLIKGNSLTEAIHYAETEIRPHFPEQELSHFSRILDGSVIKAPLDEIESSRYVIHTLEAALYCSANSCSLEEAVLKAVNLGEDSDTAAAMTGAVNGLIYGYDSIPAEWLDALAKKEMIEELMNKFLSKYFAN